MTYQTAWRRYWWVALGGAIVFVLFALIAQMVLPVNYSSTAQYAVSIDPVEQGDTRLASSAYEAQLLASTYAVVLGSDTGLLGQISPEVGLDADEVRRSLDVGAIPSSFVLRVTFSNADPSRVEKFFPALDDILSSNGTATVPRGALTRVTDAEEPALIGRQLFHPALLTAGALGLALAIPALFAYRNRRPSREWSDLSGGRFASIVVVGPDSALPDTIGAGLVPWEDATIKYASPAAERAYQRRFRSQGATRLREPSAVPHRTDPTRREAPIVILVALDDDLTDQILSGSGAEPGTIHLLVLPS